MLSPKKVHLHLGSKLLFISQFTYTQRHTQTLYFSPAAKCHAHRLRLIRTLHFTSHGVVPPSSYLGTRAHFFYLSISWFVFISNSVCVHARVWVIGVCTVNKQAAAWKNQTRGRCRLICSCRPLYPLRSPLQGHMQAPLGCLPSNTVCCSSLISTGTKGQCWPVSLAVFTRGPLHLVFVIRSRIVCSDHICLQEAITCFAQRLVIGFHPASLHMQMLNIHHFHLQAVMHKTISYCNYRQKNNNVSFLGEQYQNNIYCFYGNSFPPQLHIIGCCG